jgi:RNA polymerase sigma-70 factor (ECF subfamily)
MDPRDLLDLTFARGDPTILCVEAEASLIPGGGGSAEPAHLQAALAGDPEGYRQLFRSHAPRVHRLIRRLSPPGQDLEDVVQCVFVEAFRGLPSFRGESSFATWLSRIALRVARRKARWGAPRFVPLDDEAPSSAPGSSPEADLEARRALQAFQRILAGLSEKRRTVFILHVLEGHRLEEVATILDAKVGAVKVRLHDARREIEKQARREPALRRYLGWKE